MAVPAAPSPITFSDFTQGSVRCTFTQPSGDILERRVGYSFEPGRQIEAFFGAPNSSPTSAVVTGLELGQTYFFHAYVRNAEGWSLYNPNVERAATIYTVPGAPSAVGFSNVKQTSVTAQFSGNPYQGGTPVQEYVIGYGLNPSEPTVEVQSGGFTSISGLQAGKTYYFWARARNIMGWSSRSSRTQVTLLAGARVKVGTEWKRALPYVNVNGVWKLARPWVKTGGLWKETS